MPKEVNATYIWISPDPVKVGSTLLVVKLILPYSSHNLQGWITNFSDGFLCIHVRKFSVYADTVKNSKMWHQAPFT